MVRTSVYHDLQGSLSQNDAIYLQSNRAAKMSQTNHLLGLLSLDFGHLAAFDWRQSFFLMATSVGSWIE
jgi:hypothetical protein